MALLDYDLYTLAKFGIPGGVRLLQSFNHKRRNLGWLTGDQIVAYYFLLIVYRLTLHPLAKYPGPKLWAISPIPSIYYLLNGRISFQYKILHDKYGPVIRVMPK
jgi:hypothetical protein